MAKKSTRILFIEDATSTGGYKSKLQNGELEIKDSRKNSLRFMLKNDKATNVILVYMGLWIKLDKEKVSDIKENLINVIKEDESKFNWEGIIKFAMSIQLNISKMAWGFFRNLVIRILTPLLNIINEPEENYYTAWFKIPVFSLKDKRHDAMFINMLDIMYQLRAEIAEE